MAVSKRGRRVPTQTKRRSCDGKAKHWCRADADKERDRKIRYGAHPDTVNVYPCKFGAQHHWHVGHTPGNLSRR